jgi:hypothetical protein
MVVLLTSASLSGDIHWIGGWVGRRTGLDYVDRRNLAPTMTRTPTPRLSSPYRLRYPGTLSEVGESVKINVPQGELRDVSQSTKRMRR